MKRDTFYVAVQCVLINRTSNRVLVGRWKRRSNNGKYTITFPGGHLEHSDSSIADAAVRELKEETGLESKVLAIGTPIINNIGDRRYLHIPVLMDIDDYNAELIPNEEFHCLWWKDIYPNPQGKGQMIDFDWFVDEISISTKAVLEIL